MFSGLIAHRGIVVRNDDARGGRTLAIAMPGAVHEGIAPKDSIAIDGVCLTATRIDGDAVVFDVVPETIGRSTLGELSPGTGVNVELSLRIGERMGGHFVYGHVDATATIARKVPEGQGFRLFVSTPSAIARYIVEKGYVAVDGVSLTIAGVHPGEFAIALIPETAERTTLGRKGAGDRVNLEIDPIARYALAAAAEITDAQHDAELAWAYEI